VQGVHFTVPAHHREWILEKIESWFDGGMRSSWSTPASPASKDSVHHPGVEYREIDRLFLAILRDDELVDDYCMYEREEE